MKVELSQILFLKDRQGKLRMQIRKFAYEFGTQNNILHHDYLLKENLDNAMEKVTREML